MLKLHRFGSYLALYYLTVGILFEFGILINYINYSIFVVFLVIGVNLSCFVIGLLLFIILQTVWYIICLVWLRFSWISGVCGLLRIVHCSLFTYGVKQFVVYIF